MNKKPLIGVVAVCVAVAAAATVGKKRAAQIGGGASTTKWDRMRQHMENLPEGAPPRMMFENVAATRANTEQILELLHAERVSDDELPTGT